MPAGAHIGPVNSHVEETQHVAQEHGHEQPKRIGLHGQNNPIRRDYSTPAAEKPPDAKSSRNPLQTKGISRSTSDPCRTTAGPLPKQHACHTTIAWFTSFSEETV